MDRDLVAPVILGDQEVLMDLSTEGFNLSPVIYPSLELFDESGRKGINENPSMIQCDDKKEMDLRRGREGHPVKGDFKINVPMAPRS